MQLKVNGENVSFEGSTVIQLLEMYKIDPLGVVVEKNGSILHREKFTSETLVPNDSLEIVQFVGGG